MENLLIAIEILGVGGILLIFVLYFVFKARLKKQKIGEKESDISKN